LSEVRALLLPHLQGERIKWSSNIQDDQLYSPIIVEAVQDELKQVFLNIGLNAIQSMQSQGGTLFVEINLEDDRVGVSFRDTGPGISKKDLGSLFEPFYTTKADGLGLGLPICYDIVQRHGGQISVASHPGEGATFTVWLPLKPE
jgi:signal transduction histidine kinase